MFSRLPITLAQLKAGKNTEKLKNEQYRYWGYQNSFFFRERYFKCKKHKQKHLSNIQPNISKQKSTLVTFIETNMYLSTKKSSMKHLE